MVIPGTPRIRGYAELAALFRQKIQDGELRPGQRLPAEPDLMATYGLARETVRRAMKTLRDEGLADHVRGWGTVVREPREVVEVHIGPGCRVRARPATVEERAEFGEGVAMLDVEYPDGRIVSYPGDETVLVADGDSHGRDD